MVKDLREKWDISSDQTEALTGEMHTVKKKPHENSRNKKYSIKNVKNPLDGHILDTQKRGLKTDQ